MAQDLLKAGKIRSMKVLEKTNAQEPAGRKVAKHFKKAHPAKDWMAQQLLIWCQARGIVLQEELEFALVNKRKFRFDWAIEGAGLKIAIEYEGLMSKKSRHTTNTGYTKDTDKYNMALALGWKPIRFTALNYKDLITELNKHV